MTNITLKDAVRRTNSEILQQRRMLTLLESPQTVKIFATNNLEADPKQMETFSKLFLEMDIPGLRYWLSKFIDPELGELGIRELRVIAASHGVELYYRLTKLELIQGINNARKRSKERANSANQGLAQGDGKTDSSSGSGTKKVRQAGEPFREQA